jgi:hypothetical protein
MGPIWPPTYCSGARGFIPRKETSRSREGSIHLLLRYPCSTHPKLKHLQGVQLSSAHKELYPFDSSCQPTLVNAPCIPCIHNTGQTLIQDVTCVYNRVFVFRHYYFLNPLTDFDEIWYWGRLKVVGRVSKSSIVLRFSTLFKARVQKNIEFKNGPYILVLLPH